ncbi:MAG: hypothetical protein A2Y62_11745 [Candidatus Fischerbacteria bacterium RBG_13_37_8]|uniref:Uncharacterized protein n=1 Tax=Candidatus Fischerbacteria bacterium RBG_13_37_8 TaxID=1817863 RepID=A0A1F5VH71_9BACT|nr:MAG: hypothetical protein A2Y62_11745 [Candidatus Fischerbacteria bacterium RBG_13_37_8]
MFWKKEDKGQKGEVNIVQYEKMVNDLIGSFGVDPEKCRHRPRNLWSLYKGSALIYIEIFKADKDDFIEASSPIMKLPSRNLLAFYRKLLELNFQNLGVKYFVRDDWVYLAENRQLQGLDYDELRVMVERVGGFADQWDDPLIEEFKSR